MLQQSLSAGYQLGSQIDHAMPSPSSHWQLRSGGCLASSGAKSTICKASWASPQCSAKTAKRTKIQKLSCFRLWQLHPASFDTVQIWTVKGCETLPQSHKNVSFLWLGIAKKLPQAQGRKFESLYKDSVFMLFHSLSTLRCTVKARVQQVKAKGIHNDTHIFDWHHITVRVCVCEAFYSHYFTLQVCHCHWNSHGPWNSRLNLVFVHDRIVTFIQLSLEFGITSWPYCEGVAYAPWPKIWGFDCLPCGSRARQWRAIA